MPSEKPNAPRKPSNILRDIHEHEVFLSFTDDADAERFHEWWQSVGLKAWQEWCVVGGADAESE